MAIIGRIIKKADILDKNFKPLLDGEVRFKTTFGGCYSLILISSFIFAFAYTFYLIFTDTIIIDSETFFESSRQAIEYQFDESSYLDGSISVSRSEVDEIAKFSEYHRIVLKTYGFNTTEGSKFIFKCNKTSNNSGCSFSIPLNLLNGPDKATSNDSHHSYFGIESCAFLLQTHDIINNIEELEGCNYNIENYYSQGFINTKYFIMNFSIPNHFIGYNGEISSEQFPFTSKFKMVKDLSEGNLLSHNMFQVQNSSKSLISSQTEYSTFHNYDGLVKDPNLEWIDDPNLPMKGYRNKYYFYRKSSSLKTYYYLYYNNLYFYFSQLGGILKFISMFKYLYYFIKKFEVENLELNLVSRARAFQDPEQEKLYYFAGGGNMRSESKQRENTGEKNIKLSTIFSSEDVLVQKKATEGKDIKVKLSFFGWIKVKYFCCKGYKERYSKLLRFKDILNINTILRKLTELEIIKNYYIPKTGKEKIEEISSKFKYSEIDFEEIFRLSRENESDDFDEIKKRSFIGKKRLKKTIESGFAEASIIN